MKTPVMLLAALLLLSCSDKKRAPTAVAAEVQPPTRSEALPPEAGPLDVAEGSMQEELQQLSEQHRRPSQALKTRLDGFEVELLGWVPRGPNFRVAYLRLENSRPVGATVALEQAELLLPAGTTVAARRVIHSSDEEKPGLVRAGGAVIVGAVFEWTAQAAEASALRLPVATVPFNVPLHPGSGTRR